jgi:hypothetical protein
MNTLHGMPFLLHLSPTQSELENSNVHYSGFDIDLSTIASADDQSINNGNPFTDPVIEKCSFQRNTIHLPGNKAVAGSNSSCISSASFGIQII